ncbi:hypothetical protein SAMN05216328_14444 [Ensifer sp. YR511]|nr:hypothetical protein SAMN05216328_14444 [Ensifer sp. YR511]
MERGGFQKANSADATSVTFTDALDTRFFEASKLQQRPSFSTPPQYLMSDDNGGAKWPEQAAPKLARERFDYVKVERSNLFTATKDVSSTETICSALELCLSLIPLRCRTCRGNYMGFSFARRPRLAIRRLEPKTDVDVKICSIRLERLQIGQAECHRRNALSPSAPADPLLQRSPVRRAGSLRLLPWVMTMFGVTTDAPAPRVLP